MFEVIASVVLVLVGLLILLLILSFAIAMWNEGSKLKRHNRPFEDEDDFNILVAEGAVKQFLLDSLEKENVGHRVEFAPSKNKARKSVTKTR